MQLFITLIRSLQKDRQSGTGPLQEDALQIVYWHYYVYMDDVWAPNYRQVGAPMKINRFIKLPCKYTTCCCFGGQDLDLLFVTSAYNNSSDNGRLLVLDQDSQDTLNHVVGRGIKEEPIKL